MPGALVMGNVDREIKTAKASAEKQMFEHLALAEEMAAIQKELERRVSMAKPRKGKKPWNSGTSR